MIKDDLLFEPYMLDGEQNGWQCKIKTKRGTISVRFGGYGIISDDQHPYEVWYPTESAPDGRQTAEDIFDYIKNSHHDQN